MCSTTKRFQLRIGLLDMAPVAFFAIIHAQHQLRLGCARWRTAWRTARQVGRQRRKYLLGVMVLIGQQPDMAGTVLIQFVSTDPQCCSTIDTEGCQARRIEPQGQRKAEQRPGMVRLVVLLVVLCIRPDRFGLLRQRLPGGTTLFRAFARCFHLLHAAGQGLGKLAAMTRQS